MQCTHIWTTLCTHILMFTYTKKHMHSHPFWVEAKYQQGQVHSRKTIRAHSFSKSSNKETTHGGGLLPQSPSLGPALGKAGQSFSSTINWNSSAHLESHDYFCCLVYTYHAPLQSPSWVTYLQSWYEHQEKKLMNAALRPNRCSINIWWINQNLQRGVLSIRWDA